MLLAFSVSAEQSNLPDTEAFRQAQTEDQSS